MTANADTIYALSTAAGRAGVAVIRVSGPKAFASLKALNGKVNPARRANLSYLRFAEKTIDHAITISFPAPHSFTGEDVVELQLHGGRAIITAVSQALAQLGCRMAEPGEFTRRAFLNDKLDLTEAEGLADLIDAETEAQRKQALRQMGGELSQVYENWRGQLVRILAHCEADIDFPDEDLPKNIIERRINELQQLAGTVEAYLNDKRRGERLREGFNIAIVGAPNVGKSSLLNALAGRDAAIVSTRAGTTRDVVEVHLDIGGYPVILADTAGLRETSDAIEQEGIKRALQRAEHADLTLVLFNAEDLPRMDTASEALINDRALVVLSKWDLLINNPYISKGWFPVSAKNGFGINVLLANILEKLRQWNDETGAPPLTRERHREALQACLSFLKRAVIAYQEQAHLELVAEDIRLATRQLGRITGRVDVEDLLDMIFKDFCVGK